MTTAILDIMAHKESVAIGRKEMAEEAAKMLELSPSTIRLHAGEMTAQEMRTVQAVLAWRAQAIRALIAQ